MPTRRPDRLRVGITIGLHHPAETLWNNGIKQNAVFLAEALKHCPNVASVVLANTTAVPITEALPWDLKRWPTIAFDASQDQFDVLIELGGQINAEQTELLKKRGGRLVSYCCGSEYVTTMESILFDRPMWGSNLFINQRYDAVWVIPQVAGTSRSYFEVFRRQTATEVPFVWSPVFLEERTRALPHAGIYQPRQGARRLSVLEPNINIVKFCLYPALIAEEAYRARPDAIALLQVTNADRIARESMEFITLMNQLDIVRDRKAVFLGRHETPVFLAENTDIVVSHQLENPLNYLYLEVCWQGFPLVHNATLCPDLGYYYDGNDVRAGAARLLEAIDGHDAEAASYRSTQRERIARFLPDDAALVARYTELLGTLFSQPLR
ncbi:MAG: DUF2827 domain-containing protein [Variovorax sp.]|nr:MAG: DUF2827 domain-containing protein [Variovorax sp.]